MPQQYSQTILVPPPNLEQSGQDERIKYLSEKVIQMQRSIDFLERERNRMRHELDSIKAALNSSH